MSIPQHRTWMYDRLIIHRHVKLEFEMKLKEFLDHASDRDESRNNNNTMRCPFARCNYARGGFKKNCSGSSLRQRVHGRVLYMEVSWRGGGVREIVREQSQGGPSEELQPFEQMVYDIA